MSRVVIDFETRSACDLKARGTWNYSVDASTEILCLGVKVPGKPARIILSGDVEDARALLSFSEVWAHNAFFDFAVWNNVCTRRYGWPPLPAEKMRCSAAVAAVHALPRGLARVGDALGLDVRKDVDGARILAKLSKPRATRPRSADEGSLFVDDAPALSWNTAPADLAALYAYCKRDVQTTEAVIDALGSLSETELRVWQLDQEINRRGIPIDRVGAAAVVAAVADYEPKLLERLKAITGGAVRSGKQVAALLCYLQGLGVNLPDLGASTVAAALAADIQRVVREILEIRQALARSSSAKFQTMLDMASADGRVHDTMLYHGASTGRWSGKGVQPHNFPSRIKVSADPAEMLEAIVSGGLDWFETLYDDDLMAAAGAITRSVIMAPAGRDFIAADYSAVEGRGIAWLAGDAAELAVYESGKDPYINSAARILKKPYEAVTKAERQSPGKISVLACIAEGSPVLTDIGLVPIEDVSRSQLVWDGVEWVPHGGPVFRGCREVMEYDELQATSDHVVFTEEGEMDFAEAIRRGCRLVMTARGREAFRPRNSWRPFPLPATRRAPTPVWDLLNCGPRNRFTVSGRLVHNCGYQGGVGAVRKFGGGGMTDDEIMEQIVKPWRESHPQVVAFWRGLEDACKAAVANPGTTQTCGRIIFKSCEDRFLKARLPSGRLLYYYDPEIQTVTTSWGARREQVTYMTVDAMTKQWARTSTYGGKLAENVVSGTCRDLLAEAMLRVEAAGYRVVMTVHDEIVVEVPEGFGSLKEFTRLMCVVPKWAAGFPIAASGWRGKRCRK